MGEIRPQIFLAICTILDLTAVSSLVAQPAILVRNLPVAREEPLLKPTAEEKPPLRDVTPPELALPVEAHAEAPAKEGGIYGSAEYLLLRPQQRGLDFALVDPVDDLTPQGRLRSVRNETRSGFRVGLGYRFANSGWDVGFNYTTFHSKGEVLVVAPPGGLIYPELTRPGLTDSALSALANSRLNYNIYDLEVGKQLDLDEWTQLRLFGGLRFAGIQQSVNAFYNGGLADNASAQSRSNFYGAGPLAGAEMRWKIFRGFSLFGKAEGGLIYGRTTSTLLETNNAGATLYSDVNELFRPIVPVVGLAIGGSYQFRGITMSAGYQVVNWFGLIQRTSLVDDFAEGRALQQSNDLSIDGFFFKMGFLF